MTGVKLPVYFKIRPPINFPVQQLQSAKKTSHDPTKSMDYYNFDS
jgi:hypothetical protein